MNSFEQFRSALAGDQTFGTWSLIVTFFGDMAQHPGDRLSGTALTKTCECLSIRPEAMRVALHRLRKDGWIESTKFGRRSYYSLTDQSREESIKASPLIYAKSTQEYPGISVLVSPDDPSEKKWLKIAKEVWVQFGEASNSSNDGIVMHYRRNIPTWLKQRILSKADVDEYSEFRSRLVSIRSQNLPNFSPHQAAALRVLIVHYWRRLVLKHQHLPDEAFPTDCPIKECRALVGSLLNAIPKPNLAALE